MDNYDEQYIKIFESLSNRELTKQRIKETIENLAKDRERVMRGIPFDNSPHHDEWWDYTHAILDLKFFQDDLTRIWDKDNV